MDLHKAGATTQKIQREKSHRGLWWRQLQGYRIFHCTPWPIVFNHNWPEYDNWLEHHSIVSHAYPDEIICYSRDGWKLRTMSVTRIEVGARRTIAALISKGNGVPSSESLLNNAQTTAMLVIVYIKPGSAITRIANTKARCMRWFGPCIVSLQILIIMATGIGFSVEIEGEMNVHVAY